MNKTAKIIVSIVVLAVVAGGAFWGGMVYKANTTPSRTSAFAKETARAGGAGRRQRHRRAGETERQRHHRL